MEEELRQVSSSLSSHHPCPGLSTVCSPYLSAAETNKFVYIVLLDLDFKLGRFPQSYKKADLALPGDLKCKIL